MGKTKHTHTSGVIDTRPGMKVENPSQPILEQPFLAIAGGQTTQTNGRQTADNVENPQDGKTTPNFHENRD